MTAAVSQPSSAKAQRSARTPGRDKHGGMVIYGAAVRGWTQFTGVALFAVGARILGVSDFGVFALSVAFINVVQVFLYSGLYEFVMKSRPEDGLDQTALRLNLGVSAIGALASTLMGYGLAVGSRQPEVFTLTLAMSPSALIAGVAAWHEAQVLRQNRYGVYYANWAVIDFVAAVVGVVLLFLHAGLFSLVVYRYLQTGLMLLGYIVFSPVSYVGRFRADKVREMMRFAAPIYGSRLLSALSNYGVDLVVGLLIGPAATGLYRMSSRIVSSVTEALFQPLRVLSWVRAGKARGSARRVSLSLLSMNHVATLVLWPGSVIIAFVAGDALRLGLGPKWAAATPIIATLLLSRCLGTAEIFLEPLFATTGAGRRLVVVRIVSIAVMFAALLVSARYGASYTGVANLAASVIILAAVAPRVMAQVGAARVWGSMQAGAFAALGTGIIFAVAQGVVIWNGVNELTAHLLATVLSGLLLGVLLLREAPNLALFKLRRAA